MSIHYVDRINSMIKIKVEATESGFIPRCDVSRNFASAYGCKIFSLNQIRALCVTGADISLVCCERTTNALNEWRQGMDITQAEAAAIYGVARVTYAGWERTGRIPKSVLDKILLFNTQL